MITVSLPCSHDLERTLKCSRSLGTVSARHGLIRSATPAVARSAAARDCTLSSCPLVSLGVETAKGASAMSSFGRGSKTVELFCPCCPLAVLSSPWVWGHAAMVTAAAYQQLATWHLSPLSNIIWRYKPALLLALFIHAVVHCTMGKRHPRWAASVSCNTLSIFAAHRYCAAIMTPTDMLHEELKHFKYSGCSGSIILCAWVGAFLAGHSETPRWVRASTLMLFNGAYVARGFELYRRTGSQHREFVQFTLLCICLPFCASFLLGPLIGQLLCPRAPHGQKRPVHEATRMHVDSMCATCCDFLAVTVLQPCGLGLCPDCFHYHFGHPFPRERMPYERRPMASMMCPQCQDPVSDWVSIKHCDLEDEKAV